MKRTKWFDRTFPPINDNGLLPSVIERLAGTPARVAEITGKIKKEQELIKPGNTWSIREEIGHLSDLEYLWSGRVDDLVNKAPGLRAADLTNQRTHTAGHNATGMKALVMQFREQRQRFVNKLWDLDEATLNHTSLHPRLGTPMRIIDLAYFVAEHDDHHLTRIREIMNS